MRKSVYGRLSLSQSIGEMKLELNNSLDSRKIICGVGAYFFIRRIYNEYCEAQSVAQAIKFVFQDTKGFTEKLSDSHTSIISYALDKYEKAIRAH